MIHAWVPRGFRSDKSDVQVCESRSFGMPVRTVLVQRSRGLRTKREGRRIVSPQIIGLENVGNHSSQHGNRPGQDVDVYQPNPVTLSCAPAQKERKKQGERNSLIISMMLQIGSVLSCGLTVPYSYKNLVLLINLEVHKIFSQSYAFAAFMHC